MGISLGTAASHPQPQLNAEELVAAGQVLHDYGRNNVRTLSMGGKVVEGPARDAAIAAYEKSQDIDSRSGRAFDATAALVNRVMEGIAAGIGWVARPLVHGLKSVWRAVVGAKQPDSRATEPKPAGPVRQWVARRVERASAVLRENLEHVAIGADAEVELVSGEKIQYCPFGTDKRSTAANERRSIAVTMATVVPVGLVASAILAPFAPAAAGVCFAFPVVETAIIGSFAVFEGAVRAPLQSRQNHFQHAEASRNMAAKYALLAGMGWLGFGGASPSDVLAGASLSKDASDLARLRDE